MCIVLGLLCWFDVICVFFMIGLSVLLLVVGFSMYKLIVLVEVFEFMFGILFCIVVLVLLYIVSSVCGLFVVVMCSELYGV